MSTLLQTGTPDGHPLDALIRASARSRLHVALEQEVTDCLGRAHDQRGARRSMRHRGHKQAVTAVAHTLRRTTYHLLARQTAYQDLGVDDFDRRQSERVTHRAIQLLHRRGYHGVSADLP